MSKILRPPEHASELELERNIVFLAGGISNCPDWQYPVSSNISNSCKDLLIINPRRDNWNMDSQAKESIDQIKWEHFYLSKSDHILFWFPEETLCPITLFELGAALHSNSKIMIGAHPNYQRRLDVEIQTSLVRPEIKVYKDLRRMVMDFIDQIND